MTEKEREEAIRYIMSQLEDGYIDLGLHDQNELVVIKEAMDMLRIVDKWNRWYANKINKNNEGEE